MRELLRRFWHGFSSTLGIAQVRRHVESPAESFEAVGNDVHSATQEVVDEDGSVELPRRHPFDTRRWRMPDGSIVFEAYNPEAIELLKTDPDEFFRISRQKHF